MVDISHLFAERYIETLIAKALELDIQYNSAYYIPLLREYDGNIYSIDHAWKIGKGSFHDKLDYITRSIVEDHNTVAGSDESPTIVYRTPVWLVLLIWNDSQFFDIFGSYYTPISYTVIMHKELLQKEYGIEFCGLENFFRTDVPHELSNLVVKMGPRRPSSKEESINKPSQISCNKNHQKWMNANLLDKTRILKDLNEIQKELDRLALRTAGRVIIKNRRFKR